MATVSIVPGVLNLDLYRGDSFTQQVTLTQAGDPVVLDTEGWLAQIRATTNAATVLDTINVDATSAATGVLVLSLTAEQTTALIGGVWDLQQTVDDTVRTWLAGTVTVSRDVTHD